MKLTFSFFTQEQAKIAKLGLEMKLTLLLFLFNYTQEQAKIAKLGVEMKLNFSSFLPRNKRRSPSWAWRWSWSHRRWTRRPTSGTNRTTTWWSAPRTCRAWRSRCTCSRAATGPCAPPTTSSCRPTSSPRRATSCTRQCRPFRIGYGGFVSCCEFKVSFLSLVLLYRVRRFLSVAAYLKCHSPVWCYHIGYACF